MDEEDNKLTKDILNNGYELKANTVNINKQSKELKEDEDLVISKVKKKKISAPYPYLAVGNGKRFKSKDSENSIDLIEAMTEMKTAARRALNRLKDSMKDNEHIDGIIKVKRTGWSKQEIKDWEAGVNDLISQDFVRRVKKGHYIINPKLIVPTGDPTVDKNMSNERKTESHNNYINGVITNWSKAVDNP